MKTRKLLGRYYKKTPVKVRIIADSVCVSCLTITTATIVTNYPKIAVTFLIIGAVFKGISNFCVEDQKKC